MKLLRPVLMLAVIAMLFAVPSSSSAAKAKKKKVEGEGVVEQISDDTLTVKIDGVTKKFMLTKETKFEKEGGKKAKGASLPATAAEVKVGDRVLVTASGDKADTVKILGTKKKKK